MKNIIVSGLIALVVALGVGYSFQSTSGPQGPAGKDGTSLGNVTSPDRFPPGGQESINGFKTVYLQDGMSQGTTTVFSKLITATSTLVSANCTVTRATSTAFILHIAKSVVNNNNATTTLLAKGAYAASALGVVGLVGSTTPGMASTYDAKDGTNVFGPGQYLNVGIQGATGGPIANPGGICQAVFYAF